jgi:hypothetical protein
MLAVLFVCGTVVVTDKGSGIEVKSQVSAVRAVHVGYERCL